MLAGAAEVCTVDTAPREPSSQTFLACGRLQHASFVSALKQSFIVLACHVSLAVVMV